MLEYIEEKIKEYLTVLLIDLMNRYNLDSRVCKIYTCQTHGQQVTNETPHLIGLSSRDVAYRNFLRIARYTV